MCTSQVALMDMERGTLARIDRRILCDLDSDERWADGQSPGCGAVWSTWRRYCDAAGTSMGRAITALIEHELGAVIGQDDGSVFGAEIERRLVGGP